MNLSETLNSLDPAFASARTKIWMTAQIFNGLVTLDSVLNIQPAISDSVHISEDKKTYTFYLKKEVYFHKDALFGKDSTRAVTADDFVYSFRRICDPELGSSGSWIFRDKILGVEAFREGKVDEVKGFRSLDKHTPVSYTHLTLPTTSRV